MSKKLFIGGLTPKTSDLLLLETFRTYGEITEARVVTDMDTGRSRGYGFVTFADSEAADRAIAELDGKELDGRTVKVNEAQAKPRGGGNGSRGGRGGW